MYVTEEAKMTDEEFVSAMALLKSPRILERILADFEACGVIGEETNKLVGYIAAVSRKLESPLAVLIQSSSAAGKSSLMEAVLAMVPVEERVKYSAMTGQSLFYMGEKNLKHKILAIAEEEGATSAAYALKLLQSEGEINIASTGKDPQTGRHVTHEYRVEGPVMMMMTTTAIEIDEELLNRCVVLTVNEERAQTKLIHDLQRDRQTIEGLLAKNTREAVLKLHQNAQRLLRPILVANPFARELKFIDTTTRARRDHMKYLTLIRAVALLHQYQRTEKRVVHRGEEVPYIEVTPQDIEVANKLCHEVLGRSLDELAPQTRRLLQLVVDAVNVECGRAGIERVDYRFTRRQVREWTGWSDFQVQKHMNRLTELEYVAIHRGMRGSQYVYELIFDGAGDEEGRRMAGLVEVKDGRITVEGLHHAGLTQGLLQGDGEFEPPNGPALVGVLRGSSPVETGSSGSSSEETALNQ